MKQAIILAAGEGRRLRPFTANRPKSMIRIAGKPIIQYVIEALASINIREIVIVVGYKREQVFDYLGDGKQFGVSIKYVIQDKQIGTAQALNRAKELADDYFMVLAGDKLITPETIKDLELRNSTTVLVKRVEDPSRYGVVRMDKERVVDIEEKPSIPRGNLINTGIYVFEKNIFSFINNKLDIPEVMNDVLERGVLISGVETDQPWLDIVYPWDILTLNSTLLGKTATTYAGTIEPGVTIKENIKIGKGTIIRANCYLAGPVVIGENCEIGPYACIYPSTSIANNVKVLPFSRIKNCVIGDNVILGASTDIEDSVIDNGCNIGSHFSAFSEKAEIKIDWQVYLMNVGTMIGEMCEIGSQVVALPGVILGNYSKIRSQKTISSTLADKSIVV